MMNAWSSSLNGPSNAVGLGMNRRGWGARALALLATWISFSSVSSARLESEGRRARMLGYALSQGKHEIDDGTTTEGK